MYAGLVITLPSIKDGQGIQRSRFHLPCSAPLAAYREKAGDGDDTRTATNACQRQLHACLRERACDANTWKQMYNKCRAWSGRKRSRRQNGGSTYESFINHESPDTRGNTELMKCIYSPGKFERLFSHLLIDNFPPFIFLQVILKNSEKCLLQFHEGQSD